MAGVQRERYAKLCPIGRRLDTREAANSSDVSVAARKLSHALTRRPDRVETLEVELERLKDERDGIRIELARHVAHCAEGCERPTKNPMAFIDTRIKDGFSSAPSHQATPLPGGATLAAQIREGQTAEGLAAVYGRPVSTITRVLNTAGFSAVTGRAGTRGNTAPSPGVMSLGKRLLNAVPTWVEDGTCAQTDPELFFPEPGQTNASAKQVCGGCPVTTLCLEYALENDERFGVWGGTSPRDRDKLRRTAGA